MPTKRKDPDPDAPVVAAAVRSFRDGDHRTAQRLCQQVLSRSPANVTARHVLGLIAIEGGALEIGIGHLELLSAQHPLDPAVRLSLAKAYGLAQRPDDAAELLEQILQSGQQTIDIILEISGQLTSIKQEARAIEVLGQARAFVPDHLGLLNNLGGLLAASGKIDDGIACLDDALALDPGQAVTHYNLGKARRQSGDLNGAAQHYRRAVELNSGFVTAAHNLGNLLLDQGRVEEAADAFTQAVRAKREVAAPDRGQATFRQTNTSKLKHDIEQFEYLIVRGLLGIDQEGSLTAYRAALSDLLEAGQTADSVPLPESLRQALAPTYNRLVHTTPAPALAGPSVDPEQDWAAVEADYRAKAPGMTFVDGFLTPEALASLRRFCLESTIWFGHRYANGYLGAFMDDGFCCPLLLQIAEELRVALPGIFGTATLRKLWAFKYDSQLSGIPMHADFATVNVNFWITPDTANLDPESGGLVVWDKEAPLDWDFESYNADEARMRAFLRNNEAKAMTVPHRQNRVVIFNSDLFHETGTLNFKDGYENRRINITMLYGKRGDH